LLVVRKLLGFSELGQWSMVNGVAKQVELTLDGLLVFWFADA